jgi:hypothetical protein
MDWPQANPTLINAIHGHGQQHTQWEIQKLI